MRQPSLPRLVRVVAALALAMIAAAPLAQAPLEAQNGNGQGRVKVFIRFRNAPGPSEQAIVRGAGGNITQTFRIVPAIAAELPAQALAALQRNPAIDVIEPDVDVTALGTFDSELSGTWGVQRVGGGTAADAGAPVKVAVIDSGIDCSHPELQRGGVTICDGGWDFVNNDSDPYDDNGHGTHVSGTIAAARDANGVVGVAPGVRLYALKVLGANGSGSFSTVVAALQWAVDHGIQVTNNSYGSTSNPGSTVENAFINAYNAGVLNIAAAGNNGVCSPTTDTVGYPAHYDSVVSVAAVDSTNARACFSSTGPDVELAAPGVSIMSTVPGAAYASWNGTSMATPHVVGVAALVIASGVTGPANVRARLQSTATDLGAAGRDALYGFGLVNATAALGVAPNTKPTVQITSPATGTSFTSGTSVTFTGSASDTQDGNLSSSLKWTSNVQGNLGTGASISTSSLSVGTHTITATATDSGSLSGSASIQVTITAAPAPPIVSITSPGTGSSFTSGTSITFTGTANDAQDGNLSSSLKWTSNVQGALGTGASISVSSLSIGTHTITATATDTGSLSGSKSIQVTITAVPTPPSVSITSPGTGSLFVSGTSVTFTGTATDTQDGNLGSSLKWSSNVQGALGPGASISVSNLSVGTHTITATATDTSSLSGSKSIQVTITPVPTAPGVSISSPGSGSSFVSGTSVTFSGTATDAQDGNLSSSLKWTSNVQGALGTGATFSTSSLSVGTHTITAAATDSTSLTGTASIQVTITAAAPKKIARVGGIGYSTSGGKNSMKDLNISVTVVNESNAVIPGASVSLTVVGPGRTYTVSATTSTNGVGVAKIGNAPAGTYTSTVKSLSAPGYTADLSTPSSLSFNKQQ